MKKSMIAAGAASLALAAMPVLGAFAINSQTDTIVLTIADSCNVTRPASNAHGNGAASWGAAGGDTADTLSGTVQNGLTYDGTSGNQAALGTSTFSVTCNDNDGYQVTVAADGFTAKTVSGAEAWGYNKNGFASGTGSSWTLSSDGQGHNEANDIVATQSGAVSDSTFTVTYKARVSNTQQADEYTAHAVYTIAQLPAQQP